MGIIGNKTLLHKLPLTQVGGLFATDIATTQNWHCKENADKTTSTPTGYYAGGAWLLPETSGSLSMRTNSVNNLTSNLAGGVNILANFINDSILTSEGSSLMGASANIIASSSLVGSVLAQLNAICNLTGSNVLTASTFADAFMKVDFSSVNNLVINNGAVAGRIGANITSLSELSPESLASNVWSALASKYNVAGTMGEKLNGAGSAGNPWTEIIEGTYTAAEVMRLLASVAAGKTTIVDNGDNTATVVFRDINDTRDSVTVDMEGSERTDVNFDL